MFSFFKKKVPLKITENSSYNDVKKYYKNMLSNPELYKDDIKELGYDYKNYHTKEIIKNLRDSHLIKAAWQNLERQGIYTEYAFFGGKKTRKNRKSSRKTRRNRKN